jgi:hypothetical protein
MRVEKVLLTRSQYGDESRFHEASAELTPQLAAASELYQDLHKKIQ